MAVLPHPQHQELSRLHTHIGDQDRLYEQDRKEWVEAMVKAKEAKELAEEKVASFKEMLSAQEEAHRKAIEEKDQATSALQDHITDMEHRLHSALGDASSWQQTAREANEACDKALKEKQALEAAVNRTGDLERTLAAAQEKLGEVGSLMGQAIAMRMGPVSDPAEHVLIDAMRDTLQERDSARARIVELERERDLLLEQGRVEEADGGQ